MKAFHVEVNNFKKLYCLFQIRRLTLVSHIPYIILASYKMKSYSLSLSAVAKGANEVRSVLFVQDGVEERSISSEFWYWTGHTPHHHHHACVTAKLTLS